MARARLGRSVVVGVVTTLAMSIVAIVNPDAHATPASAPAAVAPAGFLARTPTTVLRAVVASVPRTVALPTSAAPASATAVALSVQVTRPTRSGVLIVGAHGVASAVHQSVVAGRSFVTSTIARVYDVACTTPDACVAVGSVTLTDGGGQYPLVETMSG